MTLEENKALVRRYIEEIINQKNLAVVDELVAPEWTERLASPGRRIEAAGPERTKRGFAALFEAYPDLTWTIDDMVAEGENVASRYTVTGTNTGDFMGRPATGKRVRFNVIGIDRIVDGKFVEAWTLSFAPWRLAEHLAVAEGEPET